MIVGIDVGGTFTDAAIIDDDRVVATAKVRTEDNLLNSLLGALDSVLGDTPKESIKRVVFSTTVITNLIAGKKYEPVGLILIPGPGLKYDGYKSFKTACVVNGAIDYRGREFIPLDENGVDESIDYLDGKGYKKVAVIGKFSTRNKKHEARTGEMIKSRHPDWQVEMAHLSAGQLNFPRRIVTSYYNCATRDSYRSFLQSVREALNERNIKAKVYILKADGGTLPLEHSEKMPVETIFSGPAASTLGVQCFTKPGETSIVVDIGGTTTDLALILSGNPLLACKGAKINDECSHVRSLAVKTLPIGGDSVLERVGRELIIYSERMGPAYCLGGPMPTPTDALRVLGLTELGDLAKARQAMHRLGGAIGLGLQEIAEKAINLMVDIIAKSVRDMFTDWEQEPAYRVWEVLQKRKVRPENVVGVGGGAGGFIDKIADRLDCNPVVPEYASVANAVGTAVAKPTLKVTLRADTEQGIYTIQEEGFEGKIEDAKFDGEKALRLAEDWLLKRARKYNVAEDFNGDTEVLSREVFNVVRNFKTVGRLYTIKVQTPRGILFRFNREGR